MARPARERAGPPPFLRFLDVAGPRIHDVLTRRRLRPKQVISFKARDGATLQAVLDAQRGLEIAVVRRWVLACLLIVLGVPLWLAAAWPGAMGRLRAVALACWALCAVSLVLAVISERRWLKRRAALTESIPERTELP